MITVLSLLGGLALVLAVAAALIVVGFRDGDRPGDALVLAHAPLRRPRAVTVAVHNPDGEPALVGLSLRRRHVRLYLEGGSYARLRTHGTAPELLAAQQTVLGVVGGGELVSFVVPAHARRRRAELVLVIGQPGRLRSLHRAVRLPRGGSAAEPDVVLRPSPLATPPPARR